MTCGNCANHVENALNSLDNVYAKVDLKKNLANVRMKIDMSEEILKGSVNKAGYRVKYID
ncbi:heavy-metal-associated domain-containing protein [Clostridium beijerinckii]|nr:heavy metal-associated domain-containing protein [Clostridium beijerinckii]NRW85700.1 copper chaperone CopZ [Clostridium beijerinckii]